MDIYRYIRGFIYGSAYKSVLDSARKFSRVVWDPMHRDYIPEYVRQIYGNVAGRYVRYRREGGRDPFVLVDGGLVPRYAV